MRRMAPPRIPQTVDTRCWRLKSALFALWIAASFGACFYARELRLTVAGWPFDYWMAAQGTVLVFIGIVAVYAWAMNRVEATEAQAAAAAGVADRTADA